MKKFLSLVLALVMTMSLVTISAGATEYKDLTDKDEIQYEEAVAVLNRLGIITGYSDGSFQPTTELTRGAAAKIIVSLMIGPEAANNLVAASAPYSDVPVDHTFAGVISYCKTSGYINGYQDGTFKPSGTLSGYAFAKMLLGALGYKGEAEGGFTGAGWTMNVARLGNESGLFDRLSFKGNEAVNREQACQLALNTLKGTLVEYSGGFTVNAGDASVTGGQTRSYKVSNQEFASHINNKKASGISNYDKDNWYTVEFGEEHFVDLRMKTERSQNDDFGRPSNEWSYKKVTIGTYPVEADFTFTTQVAHDIDTATEASKVRALGLNGYAVEAASNPSDPDTANVTYTKLYVNGYKTAYTGTVGQIADYTDNGTLVEVYVSDDTADLITDIVVVKTQLMEVKRIASDAVTLDIIKPDDNKNSDPVFSGYNQKPIFEDVEKVEDDNDNFEFLKGLKAEDYVAVVPVSTDGGNTEYKVAKAYAPETVEGKLTRVNVYGNDTANRKAISVTVGGTEYKVALWNKDLAGIKADDIKVTREDVKLFLDEYGNALRIKNVGDTSDFMVIKGKYSTLVDGKILTLVEGWDIKGNELSLNVGTANVSDYKAGDLVRYTNKGATGSAEWVLSFSNVSNIKTDELPNGIKASNVRIPTVVSTDKYGNRPYITSGVKLIYVTFDGDEVESIEVRTGLQDVSNADLKYSYNGGRPAQASLDPDDQEITAVVVKKESNDAISSNLLYVRDWDGSYEVDESGKKIYGYTVAMMSSDGLDEKTFIYSDKELDVGDFASYSLSTREGYDPFYKLKEHTATRKTTSVNTATVQAIVNEDKSIVRLTDLDNKNTNITSYQSADLGVGDEANVVSMARAEWLDLTSRGINSVGDLKDVMKDEGVYPVIQMIYNDNVGNDGFRTVSLVIITGTTGTATPPKPVDNSNTSWVAYLNGKIIKTGTVADTIALTVDAADLVDLKVVPAANNTTGSVEPAEGVATPVSGTQYTFTVTAGDGTSVEVKITLTSGTPTPATITYVLHPLYTVPTSTSVNVFVEKLTDGAGGEWLTQSEIEAIGLKADNFTLSVTGGDPNPAIYNPVTTDRYQPIGFYSYNPSFHNNDTDAAAEGGLHPTWFAQNAGFIKLQFADDDGNPVGKANANLVVAGLTGDYTSLNGTTTLR